MKELYLNNQLCDLNQSDPIQYNFQVNDIGDVESRQTTFTNTISLPRTKRNTMIFEGLGLVGDTSKLPYKKINAHLFEDTIPVIYNGWAIVSNTDDSYNLNLYSGIIDFFKTIENKNIGSDLDISETNHNKDLYSVYNSFKNEYYRYIIADYNGKSHAYSKGEVFINIDYLVPSIRCKYLLEKIQSTFGFEFFGSVFSNRKYLNWWMTYPKPSPEVSEEIDIDPILIATGSVLKLVNPLYDDGLSYININNGFNAIEGQWINDNEYKVEKAGTFNLKYKGTGNARYTWEDNWTNIEVDNRDPDLTLHINGKYTNKIIYMRNKDYELNFSVNAGDVISFVYYEIQENFSNWRLDGLNIDNFNFSIFQISSGIINFGDALIDFSIKDLFKEFLWKFGLTPISLDNKKILFLNTEERVNADVVNWTDKYNGRTNEEYLYGNYAQRNWFRHKYNSENSNYNDGYFEVKNQNLDDEKDVIQSKIYSPEKEKNIYPINSNQSIESNIYMIWQKEVQEKEDKEGNVTTEIKYKDLSNRYYFIRSVVNTNQINLISDKLRDEIKVNEFAQEDYSDLSFSKVVENEYLSLNSLINNSRKHHIKLKNLSPVDIQNLRFDVVYYFEQEQQYYILNKLPYQNAKENIGEFIRVIRK